MSRVSFHTFRHTCASLLFEGGKDVKQVSALARPRRPGVHARTYVHLMDDGLGEVDFLDGADSPKGDVKPRKAVTASAASASSGHG